MSRLKVIDAYEHAKRLRETFQAAPVKRKVQLPFTWPEKAVYVGRGRAIIYHSDKWDRIDDYKHTAEALQDVYLVPATTKIYDEDGELLQFGRDVDSINGPMPKHIAVLGESLGLQFTPSGQKRDGIQVNIPGAMWGAAVHPETGETFFVMYTQDGVHFILTGDELEITRDGAAG